MRQKSPLHYLSERHKFSDFNMFALCLEGEPFGNKHMQMVWRHFWGQGARWSMTCREIAL